ncbi:MAG TPA: hypothetical protein VF503_15805 [Sphingobium sp.]|uniref:hypothetical protein n=1 Tax=Sphingobium sp. TaxID=1912891 RepID=UPI002ED3D97E
MNPRILLPLAIATCLLPAQAWAQAGDFPIPAAASDHLPPGISTRETDKGIVYVDARGLTLYGMDFRALAGKTGLPLTYCKTECAQSWEALHPPKGTPLTPGVVLPGSPEENHARQEAKAKGEAPGTPAPKPAAAKTESWSDDWTVVEGAEGPQWFYKMVNLVFTRRGDQPGSSAFDGADSFTWNTLKYVPPVPKIAGPTLVGARYVAGAYVMADQGGRILFTPAKGEACTADCARWTVFPAGLASSGSGDWSISRTGERAQWLYRGQPVFVADGGDLAAVPQGGQPLRP